MPEAWAGQIGLRILLVTRGCVTRRARVVQMDTDWQKVKVQFEYSSGSLWLQLDSRDRCALLLAEPAYRAARAWYELGTERAPPEQAAPAWRDDAARRYAGGAVGGGRRTRRQIGRAVARSLHLVDGRGWCATHHPACADSALSPQRTISTHRVTIALSSPGDGCPGAALMAQWSDSSLYCYGLCAICALVVWFAALPRTLASFGEVWKGEMNAGAVSLGAQYR
jgi:hypothetical protein